MKPYQPDILPLGRIDWVKHVSLIARANSALARYDGILQGIVNPWVLLSPLTTQEAVLSSRIEGTQATLEEVLEFDANPKEAIDPVKQADIQEIINYRKAMSHAVERLRKLPLCLKLVRELHEILLDSVRGRNKSRGEFRRIQNWIGQAGRPMEDATFIPPSPDKLMNSLDNWEKYVHYVEKDVLVQLAVTKAQFELIHPFLDGNGRIGRMLVPLFLYEKKILSSPMFYLSGYFESHREIYYKRLQSISRPGDWDGWISFFLTAILDQAQENSRKAHSILDLYEHMKQRIVEITHSQFALQAIDALFAAPVFRSSEFIRKSEIPRQTAMTILRQLREHEILVEIRKARGRRSAIHAFPELLNIAEGRAVV